MISSTVTRSIRTSVTSQSFNAVDEMIFFLLPKAHRKKLFYNNNVCLHTCNVFLKRWIQISITCNFIYYSNIYYIKLHDQETIHQNLILWSWKWNVSTCALESVPTPTQVKPIEVKEVNNLKDVTHILTGNISLSVDTFFLCELIIVQHIVTRLNLKGEVRKLTKTVLNVVNWLECSNLKTKRHKFAIRHPSRVC